jgi:phosphoenolpyruvate phosphomutase
VRREHLDIERAQRPPPRDLRTRESPVSREAEGTGLRAGPRAHGYAPALYSGAHDALSARLAERAGFDGIWLGSLGLSAAIGVPDEGLLTLTEVLDRAFALRQAVDLPLLVDCAIGFGDGAASRRLVREASARDIAGLCVEDLSPPMRNTFSGRPLRLCDARDFARRIATMLAASASGPEIVARTEALSAGLGVTEALRRARLYTEAGAALVIVQTRSSEPDELHEFFERWDEAGPIGIIPTSLEHVGVAELCSLGASIVVFANQALRAATAAMTRVLSEIIEDRPGRESGLPSVRAILELTESSSWGSP